MNAKTTLLRIDASMRTQNSASRAVADQVETQWRHRHPEGQVRVRDLALAPPAHLDQPTYESFGEPGATSVRYSDQAIDELRAATDLLISTPLYNFGPPSTLKAWFDHIIRAGQTFHSIAGEFRPLLSGRRAVLVLARGGAQPDDPAAADLVRFVRTALAFVGWPRVTALAIAGTQEPGDRVAAAQRAAETLWDADDPGDDDAAAGDAVDRAAIASLRVAQGRAIIAGDAVAYAALCTEDIELLVPGVPRVHGHTAFVACEREIFARGTIRRFDKTPLATVIHGDFAYEIGLQHVESSTATATGVFAAVQKYTHVFRRTRAGWRFAVLMSNPSA
ncbi:MAG: NAD(P)H-dependent oxidoreductase [Kofleriaceae bacterium]|jgi:FMN-dependent NADH-azoreductase|nr:NAD(P)H-dependent oxidoreductase [Kofleriaceae bacterium]